MVVVVVVLRDGHAPTVAHAHAAGGVAGSACPAAPRCRSGPAAANGDGRSRRSGGQAAAAAAAVPGVFGGRGAGVGAGTPEGPLPGALGRASVVEVPRDLVPPPRAWFDF